MRFDPRPLRTAAVAAGVFLAVRVGYRAVFGGLGGAHVLVDLPRVRLGGPFALVPLFGPISLDGIGATLWSGLPFAAVILAFGVLAALVDVRRLLAVWARRGPARSIARAASIATATLPGLAVAVARAREAAALRGERGSPRILVPVFERTIERALALAASLEVRGFGARVRRDGRCERPVRFQDATLAPGADVPPVLSGVSFELGNGTLALVTGATGSGKTTLLRALTGLLQHFDGGAQGGLVEVGGLDRRTVPPRETAGFVGAVGQSPRDGFAGRTVADELGLALTLRGVAPVVVAARVAETAERVGVGHLLDRPIEEISAGEATRTAIGAAVIEHPVLLVVDEPLAELDASGRRLVVDLLDRLAHEAGVCVVVAEHRTEALAGIADVELAVGGGRVEARAGGRATGARTRTRVEAATAVLSRPGTTPAGTTPAGSIRLSTDALRVERAGRTLLDGVDLELRAGRILAVTGANGTGKSSLLAALARGGAGVLVDGAPVPGPPRARRARIALVPERADELFTTDTVAAECRFADRRHGRTGGGAIDRFGALLDLDRDGLDSRAGTHPRDLSGGQRLCLALALQSAGSPAVLLVDEPARGLDAAARTLVAGALRSLADDGAAVLITTHEAAFALDAADEARPIRAHRLVPAVPIAEALEVLR